MSSEQRGKREGEEKEKEEAKNTKIMDQKRTKSNVRMSKEESEQVSSYQQSESGKAITRTKRTDTHGWQTDKRRRSKQTEQI